MEAEPLKPLDTAENRLRQVTAFARQRKHIIVYSLWTLFALAYCAGTYQFLRMLSDWTDSMYAAGWDTGLAPQLAYDAATLWWVLPPLLAFILMKVVGGLRYVWLLALFVMAYVVIIDDPVNLFMQEAQISWRMFWESWGY